MYTQKLVIDRYQIIAAASSVIFILHFLLIWAPLFFHAMSFTQPSSSWLFTRYPDIILMLPQSQRIEAQIIAMFLGASSGLVTLSGLFYAFIKLIQTHSARGDLKSTLPSLLILLCFIAIVGYWVAVNVGLLESLLRLALRE